MDNFVNETDWHSSSTFDGFTAVHHGESVNLERYDVKSLNSSNADGWTLLMYAVYKGQSKFIKNLIAQGANPRVVDKYGKNLLMLAISGADFHTVTDLFAKDDLEKADVNGWTALFYAVFYGREDCTKFLVSQGSNVHAKNKLGQTAIDLAVKSGMEKMVAVLLSGESKENKKEPGVTPNKRSSKVSEIFKAKRSFTPNPTTPIPRTPDCLPPKPRTPRTPSHGPPRRALNLTPSFQQNVYSRPLTSTNVQPTRIGNHTPTILEFLEQLDLGKYWPIFRDEEVDFGTFITLEEENLKEIGITLYGPRRKISLAIKEYRAMHRFNSEPTLLKFTKA